VPRGGLPLRLVYASLWERYEGAVPSTGRERLSERVPAEHIVASAAERAARRDPDGKVTTDVVPADAVDALLHEGNNAFALVTGARGRGELKGLQLGSVGLAVAARTHSPVIVVRGDKAGLAGTHERVLFGAGDPGTGDQAVRFAFREAETRGCTLDAVRAWRCPAHEGAVAGWPPLGPDGPSSWLRDGITLVSEADRASGGVRHGAARSRRSRRIRREPDSCSQAEERIRTACPDAHAAIHHVGCPVAFVPRT
jgi:nucleotide-binding universal stress UspA family protein